MPCVIFLVFAVILFVEFYALSCSAQACDSTTMQNLPSAATLASFNRTVLFTEPSAGGAAFLYGYVYSRVSEYPYTLAEMDVLCASKCQTIDSRLYGRTAIFRSWNAYQAAFDMMRLVSPLRWVAIGAASTSTANASLNNFYWTTINTNEPSLTSPITTQSALKVTRDRPGVTDSIVGLNVAPSGTYVEAFYSYASTNMDGCYLCECGCAPYVQVGSTAAWWDEQSSSLGTTTRKSSSQTDSCGNDINRDYALSGYCVTETPEETLSAANPQACAQACTTRQWCRSFNFVCDAQDRCQLFTQSIVDSSFDPGKIAPQGSMCFHYDYVP